MIRINNIKLTLKEKDDKLLIKVAKELRIKKEEILSFRIFKEAIDARKKENIVRIFTIDVQLPDEREKEILRKSPDLQAPNIKYEYVNKGMNTLNHRPVIVGTGPCGIFAALILAQMGYKPVIIERGKKVEERVKDVEAFWKEGTFAPESNVQFGEGGAGTFSDGKLTTQIKNKRCHKVLEEFVKAGAPEHILYKSKPHIGTDILRVVVKNMREEIERLGGTFLFETKLTNLKIKNNTLQAIQINNQEWIDTQVCILAIGHSARDTFEMLYENQIFMQQKPFSIGMRIEHLQEWINKAQYGEKEEVSKLGAAEYKLVHHAKNGRTVYTFCMCPGGYVIASCSEPNSVVTNGMSEYKRDGVNANSALLVNVGPKDYESDHPLAGVLLQRKFEGLAYKLGENSYKAPVQRVGDFINNTKTTAFGSVKPTYTPGVIGANLRENLPSYMTEALLEALDVFGRKIQNFNHEDALLTGFETRSSSPVRIPRDTQYQCNIVGLYPAGEGPGYAGGITSAAVDGIEVAEVIASYYSPTV